MELLIQLPAAGRLSAGIVAPLMVVQAQALSIREICLIQRVRVYQGKETTAATETALRAVGVLSYLLGQAAAVVKGLLGLPVAPVLVPGLFRVVTAGQEQQTITELEAISLTRQAVGVVGFGIIMEHCKTQPPAQALLTFRVTGIITTAELGLMAPTEPLTRAAAAGPEAQELWL